MKLNAKNERLKRRYCIYLKEARQLSAQSVDPVLAALGRFEDHTRRRDFGDFRIEQAVAFKRHLADETNPRTGKRLSAATIFSTTTALRDFFFWLAGQPGFRSRISYSDAEYFKASLRDQTVARASRESPAPTLDQVRAVLVAMPDETPVEKRDRALLAFAILTGARDNAIASTRLKHLDLVEGRLFQDGRDMRTKFGKSFPTFFFPVGDDVEAIVRDWVEFLQNNEGFGPDDPLFPPIKSGFDSDGNFAADGFERRCWANADPIRAIFRKAFEGAGLPYFNPHSLRKTLMQLGLGLHLGADGLKAWSQNYGHDDIITTLKSYGDLPEYRQRDLMRSAGTADSDEALASRLGWEMLRRIREAGGK